MWKAKKVWILVRSGWLPHSLQVICCMGTSSLCPPSSPLSWPMAHLTGSRAVLILSVITGSSPVLHISKSNGGGIWKTQCILSGSGGEKSEANQITDLSSLLAFRLYREMNPEVRLPHLTLVVHSLSQQQLPLAEQCVVCSLFSLFLQAAGALLFSPH